LSEFDVGTFPVAACIAVCKLHTPAKFNNYCSIARCPLWQHGYFVCRQALYCCTALCRAGQAM